MNLAYFWRKLWERRPGGILSADERKAIGTLRETIASLSPATDVSVEWARNQAELVRLICSSDPRQFLCWEVIRRTMFVADAPYVTVELEALRQSNWQHWRSIISEDKLGRPFPYHGELSSSANRIHHAYHIHRFTESTGASLRDFDTIVEFGGGFGGFRRVADCSGFEGHYVIFDLPIFGALQRFYLSLVSPRASENTELVSELDDLARALRGATNVLLVATWSLSEVPLVLRRNFLDAMGKMPRGVLIAFQDEFSGIDNAAYFRKLDLGDSARIIRQPIEHLPGNQYLLMGPAAERPY